MKGRQCIALHSRNRVLKLCSRIVITHEQRKVSTQFALKYKKVYIRLQNQFMKTSLISQTFLIQLLLSNFNRKSFSIQANYIFSWHLNQFFRFEGFSHKFKQVFSLADKTTISFGIKPIIFILQQKTIIFIW